MKTANTNAKAAKAANTTVTVDAGWKFTPDSATVLGQRFAASYSVAKSGDVYAYVTVDDMGTACTSRRTRPCITTPSMPP